jgi:hypothetical protein
VGFGAEAEELRAAAVGARTDCMLTGNSAGIVAVGAMAVANGAAWTSDDACAIATATPAQPTTAPTLASEATTRPNANAM